MKYSLEECKRIYDFFDRDFFKEELGRRLGSCMITTDPAVAREYIGVEDFDTASGYALFSKGKRYIYINKYLLDNKRYMANTILHEMIHLYDQMENPYRRRYRGGHGAFWNKIASIANSIYEPKIGKIEMYASEAEVERKERSKLIHTTKTLSNAYVVVLKSRDLIPVKNLTDAEIEELKRTDIRGIFKVKPNQEQSSKNRVKNYASFEQLMNDIKYGISWKEEEMYSSLNLRLGTESERIWLNPKYSISESKK